jgi:hypothetical protein
MKGHQHMHPEVLSDSPSTIHASSTASRNNRPLYLNVLISICKVISSFLAGLHFFMIKIRILMLQSTLQNLKTIDLKHYVAYGMQDLLGE